MLIFDFFAGTGSSTQAFKDAGHTVITFELDTTFEVTEHADVFNLTAEYLLNKYGQPDFVWASPPCTAFSVASIGRHWASGGDNPVPKTEFAKISQDLVWHTRQLIKELNPKHGWLIENPRGMLRKLPAVKGLNRRTVTYCQYGDTRMKPTDLWGELPGWIPKPMCKNGDKCHTPAPRGAQTGTQGLKNAKIKSMIPYELGKEILDQILKTTQKNN
jgi:site-specific DNA-cytosine methylase